MPRPIILCLAALIGFCDGFAGPYLVVGRAQWQAAPRIIDMAADQKNEEEEPKKMGIGEYACCRGRNMCCLSLKRAAFAPD